MAGVSFSRSVDDDEATMQFYDANGKNVSAGSAEAIVQYLSNDPNRPDAKGKTSADETDKAVKAPAEDKAVKGPRETK